MMMMMMLMMMMDVDVDVGVGVDVDVVATSNFSVQVQRHTGLFDLVSMVSMLGCLCFRGHVFVYLCLLLWLYYFVWLGSVLSCFVFCLCASVSVVCCSFSSYFS